MLLSFSGTYVGFVLSPGYVESVRVAGSPEANKFYFSAIKYLLSKYNNNQNELLGKSAAARFLLVDYRELIAIDTVTQEANKPENTGKTIILIYGMSHTRSFFERLNRSGFRVSAPEVFQDLCQGKAFIVDDRLGQQVQIDRQTPWRERVANVLSELDLPNLEDMRLT